MLTTYVSKIKACVFLKKRGCTCMHKYIENLKYEKNLTAYKNSRGSSRAVAVAFLCRTL